MVSGQINTVSFSCNNLTGKGGNKLSLTELEYLKANTKYDEGDIREWYRCSHNIYQFFMGSTILIFFTHRGFKAECPDGNLGESKSITKNQIFLYALASLRSIMQID